MDELPCTRTPLCHRDHGCRANPRPVGGGTATAGPLSVPSSSSSGERCQQIEAVAMDMNTAFDLEVKQHCPQAEVVYDLFHVVARYGRGGGPGASGAGECTEKR